jgi:hypothetical protein
LVYESTPETIPFHWYHPWIVFGLLFLLAAILSYRDWQLQKLSKWFDVTLFGAAGIVGLLLFILWVATDHKAAANNFNLAWAFPFHLVGAIGLLKRTSPKWISGYFTFAAIISALLLGFWTLLPQTLNPFLLPVIFIILMRSLLVIKAQKGVK